MVFLVVQSLAPIKSLSPVSVVQNTRQCFTSGCLHQSSASRVDLGPSGEDGLHGE